MASSQSLRTAFLFITTTCLFFFIYENGPISVFSNDQLAVLHPEPTGQRSPLHVLHDILQTINSHTTRAFVADSALLSSLRYSNYKYFTDNWQTSTSNIEVVFNVGMLRSYTNQQDAYNDICDPLKQRDFACTRIESETIGPLNRSVVTHMMIESENSKLHVAFFIKVLKSVYWVQEMQQTTSGALLGVNQSEVYDAIHITSACVNDVILPVPADMESFVQQATTSRFINCDQESARNVTSAISADSKAVQANTRRSMIQMKRLMSQLATPFFLMSGSLLGWYRECRAIPYTTDADFATWSTSATQEIEDKILEITHKDTSFRVFNIFGKFDRGYEMSFLLPNGFKSDLFFLYPETESRLSSSGHVTHKRLYYKYFYPAFEICSTIFLGVRVNVPCDPENILETEYGNWKSPINDSAYSYQTSPKNRGPAISYPPNMTPLYRQYP